MTRQIGQLLSVSAVTMPSSRNHQNNNNTSSNSNKSNNNNNSTLIGGEQQTNHLESSPLDLSSAPVNKRIKLSPDSIGVTASILTSKSSSNNSIKDHGESLSPPRVTLCDREAASNEINTWTVDQVCDFVSGIDICAEYSQVSELSYRAFRPIFVCILLP